MGIQSIHFPFPNVSDVHSDVGCEWNRPAKMVFQVQKDRVPPERSDVWANVRNDHEVRGVLDQLSGIAMVGMVVVGTVCKDQIRFPSPNLSDDLPARFQCWD
jgi:hypothetical protein